MILKLKIYKFNKSKSPFLINDIDIDKSLVSNNLPFGKQDFIYFIGYKDVKKIRALCIFFFKSECI